ncbi:hypothetical protein BSMD_036950 [Bacillus subtilis Miyagi-4]|uniref:Uncharacterized protein n=1 Tax=Bacillus subtilis TaxID=1423 RepID=A0A0D1KRC6_BACIU|nr:hypothetical protein SC09_Contig24orf00490 [Bacillus subtilis]GAK81759.1 hypothetical protein BSMD_036950 [Bacillus subtilis Miyagi-4]
MCGHTLLIVKGLIPSHCIETKQFNQGDELNGIILLFLLIKVL